MPASSTARQSDFGWIISLLFWLCLLVSAALFGLIVLAPKLDTYASLDQQCYQNQYQLVKLEEQINYLTRVADALENDPEFTTQLARVDLNLAEKDTERVFVDVSLSMAAPVEPLSPPNDSVPPVTTLSWTMGHLQGVLQDQVWQKKLLVTLAVVVLFAFMFLQDPPRKPVATAPRRRPVRKKRPGPETVTSKRRPKRRR